MLPRCACSGRNYLQYGLIWMGEGSRGLVGGAPDENRLKQRLAVDFGVQYLPFSIVKKEILVKEPYL